MRHVPKFCSLPWQLLVVLQDRKLHSYLPAVLASPLNCMKDFCTAKKQQEQRLLFFVMRLKKVH